MGKIVGITYPKPKEPPKPKEKVKEKPKEE